MFDSFVKFGLKVPKFAGRQHNQLLFFRVTCFFCKCHNNLVTLYNILLFLEMSSPLFEEKRHEKKCFLQKIFYLEKNILFSVYLKEKRVLFLLRKFSHIFHFLSFLRGEYRSLRKLILLKKNQLLLKRKEKIVRKNHGFDRFFPHLSRGVRRCDSAENSTDDHTFFSYVYWQRRKKLKGNNNTSILYFAVQKFLS